MALLLSGIGCYLVFQVPGMDRMVGRAAYDADLPLIVSVFAGLVCGMAGFRASLVLTSSHHSTIEQVEQTRMSRAKWLFLGANLFIAAIAAFPSSLYLVPWGSLPRWLRWADVVALITAMLGCEEGYIFCSFVVFISCILLFVPRIPWKLKLAAASLQLCASALLFWSTDQARLHNASCGIF